MIQQMAQRFASLNMLCVKLFQAICYNNHFIDEETNKQLIQYADQVPWTQNDIDYDTLNAILCKYHLILNVNEPINAGMISLVFKAHSFDGSNPMIIKIKRKNIDTLLQEAIKHVCFVLQLLECISSFQISTIIMDNINIIWQQTNFQEEINQMLTIKDNCKYMKYVKIPWANKECTALFPNCIMMEYLEGMKINEIDTTDYEDYAKLVMKFGFVTTIVHGLTHGDLHGGNILFMKDANNQPQIGIIDFGIVFALDESFKLFLFDLFTNIFEEDAETIANKILYSPEIIVPPHAFKMLPLIDRTHIHHIVTNIINETLKIKGNVNQIQIYKCISEITNYLKNGQTRIKPSNNIIKSQFVLAMSHGVTLTLCQDDPLILGEMVINDLFHMDFILHDK
jgi:predicted unusual protein kinase regulating ubiquinone biosynthesis (AarF/ABC1/UbiB family)